MPTLPSWTRWLLSAALFSVLALAGWHGQIDDVYITLGFSHQWWETGRLAWTNGEVVEGYSNPLWMLLGVLPFAIQIDPGVFLQFVSLGCVLGILRLLSKHLTGIVGLAVLLLVASAEPVVFWGAMGMETAAFALALMGWSRLDRPTWCIGALTVACLLRPEGHAHYLAAAGVLLLQDRSAVVKPLLITGGLLALYHTTRIGWFGEWLPTTVLVKAIDNPLSGGLKQALLDVLPWLGLAGLLMLTRRLSWRDAGWAMLPAGIQLLVLIKAGGDWMGHGRLVWPGMVAALAVLSRMPERTSGKLGLFACLVLSVSGSLVVSELGNPTEPSLRGVPDTFSHKTIRLDLTTTQSTDLAYVIPRVPNGNTLYSGDVGMLGHIPGISIRDIVGLVDLDFARHRAYGDLEALARMEGRLSGEPDSVLCVRFVRWGPGEPPVMPAPFADRYDSCEQLQNQWSTIRYCCREELKTDAGLAVERWGLLSERFPAQSWLAWQHALALADTGEVSAAQERLVSALERGRGADWAALGEHALDFVQGPVPLAVDPDRGFVLSRNGSLISRPLTRAERTELRVVLSGDRMNGVGPEARLQLIGSCSSEVQTVQVGEQTSRPLTESGCEEAETLRLKVHFLNDASSADEDRNLYVRLERSY